jgi:hypothetical protein
MNALSRKRVSRRTLDGTLAAKPVKTAMKISSKLSLHVAYINSILLQPQSANISVRRVTRGLQRKEQAFCEKSADR